VFHPQFPIHHPHRRVRVSSLFFFDKLHRHQLPAFPAKVRAQDVFQIVRGDVVVVVFFLVVSSFRSVEASREVAPSGHFLEHLDGVSQPMMLLLLMMMMMVFVFCSRSRRRPRRRLKRARE
tara:strand:- start:134 stop:496 length:363 start_codon:yes stop_codon:yes gene_type:complete